MSLTHEHVAHLAKRNDSLQAKLNKFSAKAKKVMRHSLKGVEVAAGAFTAGVIQGMSKEGHATLLKVPADLAIGVGLNAVAFLDLAGEEYSEHIENLGIGFIAGFVNDKGFAVGTKRKETGSFFGKKQLAAAAPGAVAAGDISPQQMADVLLRQMGG